MGVNPVWLGVMIGVNLQTGFLTPPFGFALFYMRGVAAESIRTGDIYKGIIPFVALQVAASRCCGPYRSLRPGCPSRSSRMPSRGLRADSPAQCSTTY